AESVRLRLRDREGLGGHGYVTGPEVEDSEQRVPRRKKRCLHVRQLAPVLRSAASPLELAAVGGDERDRKRGLRELDPVLVKNLLCAIRALGCQRPTPGS